MQHPVDYQVVPTTPGLYKERMSPIPFWPFLTSTDEKLFQRSRKAVDVINFFMEVEGIMEVGQLKEIPHDGHLSFPYKKYEAPTVAQVKSA